MAAIDADRLLGRIAELGRIGAAPAGGITRLAWGPDDAEAVALVAGWGSATGARVWVDPVGTMVAELGGADGTAAPLAMGSHLDTVVSAGRLDGAYGVVVGIEVMAALADGGSRLRHPLRVAAFANEEGVVAPPFTGSRAVAGQDLAAELAAVGPDGVCLADRIARAGGDPTGLAGAAWGPVAGYLEVHIEQGPVLWSSGARTAVVSAVTGQRRARVEITGRANHAGTTPMELRHDAVVAAAHVVLAVQRLATSGAVRVATVGRLDVTPGVPNVVAGAVSLTVDLRDVDGGATTAALAALGAELDAIATATATAVHLFPTTSSAAVATDPTWAALLHAAAGAHGAPAVDLPSGAGHDAQHLATLGPIGMLFVPSTGGVSHHPDEHTDPDDLVLGARIALDAIVAADGALGA